jgi:hypothetical protein
MAHIDGSANSSGTCNTCTALSRPHCRRSGVTASEQTRTIAVSIGEIAAVVHGFVRSDDTVAGEGRLLHSILVSLVQHLGYQNYTYVYIFGPMRPWGRLWAGANQPRGAAFQFILPRARKGAQKFGEGSAYQESI